MITKRLAFNMIAVVVGALVLAGAAVAAPVKFNVSFSHTGTTPPKRPLSHIFILDRSGSMVSRDAVIEQNGVVLHDQPRWEALKASLRTTIENTPNETELRFIVIEASSRKKSFIRFNCGWWGNGGTETITMSDEYRRPESIEKIIDDLGVPNGQTPLYDVLETSVLKAWELLQTGKRVSLFVFSDGENVGGRIRSEADLRQGLARQGVPDNIVNRISLLPIWLSKDIPADKILDTEWQVPGTVPMVATIEASPATGVIVDNPAGGSEPEVRLGYDFKVSEKIWTKIRGNTGELVVRTEDGELVASHPVTFGSRDVVTINIPDERLPAVRDNAFKVYLRCKFPKESYLFCDEPDPVAVTFAKVGQVSVSIVPSDAERIAKCNGEELEFVANVKPESAVCTWSFGDGATAEGRVVRHRFAKPGVFTYRVEAVKNPLMPGKTEGRVRSVDASVRLVRPFPKAVVGEPIALKATGNGPIARYAWKVNGREEFAHDAQDGSELLWTPTPQDVGTATVEVRALMSVEMSPETDTATLTVDSKPCIQIVSPKPGDEFEIGTVIPVVALTENVKTVVIALKGPKGEDADLKTDTVRADKTVQASVKATAEAATYSVVATSADGSVKSEPVEIAVKAEPLRISISSPRNGNRVKTGSEQELVARLSGSKALMDECERVLWEANGRALANASVRLSAAGEASVSWMVDDALGGKDCTLRATVVGKDGAKTSVFDEIVIAPYVEGGVELVQPANNTQVVYDKPVKLEARTSGRAGEVAWYAELNGKTSKIGTGKTCECRFAHTGQKKTVYQVYATAQMPGGVWAKSEDVVSVIAYCPSLEPRIVLPNSEADFAIDEEILFKVASGNVDRSQCDLTDADVRQICWDFGDGTVETNDHVSVKHAFRKIAKSVRVSVRTVCAKCGEVEPHGARLQSGLSRPVVCSCVAAEIWMPGTNSVLYLGERTEFRLRNSRTKTELSDNDFKSVVWTISDGGARSSESGANVGHEFAAAGKAQVVARMVCKHCGRDSSASITRPVVNRPIAVAFGFDPDDNVFRPGTTVKFVDRSSGQVKGRKWFVDGVVVGDGRDVSRPLPGMPGEYVVNLAVCDSEGVEFLAAVTNIVQLDELAARGYLNKEKEELVRGVYYHPGHQREMKARWGQLAALIILAIAFVVWLGVWWFFHGNEPRGWTVLTSFCEAEAALEPNVKRFRKTAESGQYVDMRAAWSRLRKQATVKVGEAADGLRRRAPEWAHLPDNCVLEFRQSSSAKQAYVKAGSRFFNVVSRNNLPGDMKGRTFVFEKNFGKKGVVSHMIVFIDGVKPSVVTNFFLYIVLPLMLLGVSYYLMTVVAF